MGRLSVRASLAGALLAILPQTLAQNGSFVCTGINAANNYNATTSYLGCWTDTAVRTLNGPQINIATNDPQVCANACGYRGYNISGVEYTTQCFCGTFISSAASKLSESSCTYPCPGNSSEVCGGTYVMNLYQIDNPNPNPPPIVSKRAPACLTNPFCANAACDTSKSQGDRIAALLSQMTVEEKAQNMVDAANGVTRLGLPSYEWWQEALHGVASSPGVTFNSPNGSNFSYATSFPTPIGLGAAFDDPLIYSIAAIVGKEARAFANYAQSGFDFWTPNINTFLDPRWGRGLEVPTEDSFHAQSYVANLIPGLQGGLEALDNKQIIATCKHYAVYDVETNRNGQNYDPTEQDLGEYYLQAFKTCVRDVNVGSVMCSYNAVDGIPSCASEYLLQDILRDSYGFTEPYRYVTSDCDAVGNIYNPHNFTDSLTAAAAVALNAGTDLDCGSTYLLLNASVANNWTTEAQMDISLTRLYHALFTVGYFDGQPQYDSLSWADVGTPAAQSLAYQAAWEGMTLLKNDGLLPLSSSYGSVAMIGPWANATGQMQGNYQGIAPYLVSPLAAAQAQFSTVVYSSGTAINTTNSTGFAAALSAASGADVIIYAGGIDVSIESEGHDRSTIEWPGNQLDLIAQLSQLGKPLVVIQFGGGQVDDSALLSNSNVSAIVWGGYPGQDGGNALIDVLVGKQSIAGRLTTTQYPAKYIDEVSLFDPNLRLSNSSPGRTYKWYNQQPVLPFGYGLHYTSFSYQWCSYPKDSYAINSLIGGGSAPSYYGNSSSVSVNDASPWITVSVYVGNLGSRSSDYVGLVFLTTENAGPAPYPNKWLVAYARLHGLAAGATQELQLSINLGALARANSDGDLVIYPGDYQMLFDYDSCLTYNFTLTGEATVLTPLARQQASYTYTVPVHPQA
ncbi:hypothetical protein LTR35_013690 [Friedmanniomyces endolithicus]|uniref:xylan 1,4-beta-xylosidase n=1 Tax=Friedmanniomyces endolithicus TaxID=329885 RepID=A0AAN6J3N3_9PEZI|nr:hypothetical protein LTR35_013690 [Friedmanniomyces endolithicus]KAK0277605.1 hypothetical protein LTS00_014096 [Friedmanniomyces endolithicus]KAK0314305.1 hypothetical protein LTR82_013022 [Friedmanniomyces endolithicus]KAK0996401.1 hypothetical protein LTR54_010130 [Friedmanniomyces endolithicus]KAK0996460.1 hypothetical protein LTR54_010189 [Friedmanniomyces endolithicus]